MTLSCGFLFSSVWLLLFVSGFSVLVGSLPHPVVKPKIIVPHNKHNNNFNNLENNEILVGGLILLDTGYNDYFEELDKDYFKVGIRTEYCPKVNSTEDMEIIQLEVYLNREQNKEIYENAVF